MARTRTRPKRKENTDLADWHSRIEARKKREGGHVERAAAREKAAEMRHYRKAKTPGTGN